jgi:hypothetical protein
MSAEINRFQIPVTVRAARENAQNVLLDAAFVPVHDAETPTDAVAFGGLGFADPALAAERTATHDSGSGILIVRAPKYGKVRDAKELDDFAAQHVTGTVDYLKNENILAHDADAIGESQQAAALAKAMAANPELVQGGVAFLRSMGSVALKSRFDLVGGLVQSGLNPEAAFDKATGKVLVHSVPEFVSDLLRHHLGLTRYVLDYRLGPDIEEILKAVPNKELYVIAGSKDKLYPAEEQRAELAKYGLEDRLYKVEGGHVALSTKRGAQQLAETRAHIQSGGQTLPRYTGTEQQ